MEAISTIALFNFFSLTMCSYKYPKDYLTRVLVKEEMIAVMKRELLCSVKRNR